MESQRSQGTVLFDHVMMPVPLRSLVSLAIGELPFLLFRRFPEISLESQGINGDSLITANITTGIWGVMDNREFVDVYNLQGGVVAHRVPVKDLKKRLPCGVYIIEGRKVVIK